MELSACRQLDWSDPRERKRHVGSIFICMKKTIIGSGIYNLDTIVVRGYPEWPRLRPFTDNVVLEEVGGTCGNVMSILAWLGWDAKPLACLDDSPEGMKITEGLKRYGCDCRHVTNTPNGGTTLLRCTHKKDQDGKHVMSVRAGSPGGSRFPKRRFLRARDEAPAFLEALDEAPAVFFFDDPAAGNRLIAKGLKERGALIYFEPSKIATNADLEAVSISDIIKFSDENIHDVSFADAYNDKLFIQTMGADGVRFKLQDQPWMTLNGIHAKSVVDTEGAGDWFTAALINELAETRIMSLEPHYLHRLVDVIRNAMGIAVRSIGHMGSLGLIHYASSLQIEGAEDCPWCLSIMRDIARIAVLSYRGDELKDIGRRLYVLDWDLDRIILSKTNPATVDMALEEYSIRTWDLTKDGEIEWTFFEVVPDEDGSHGEEKYYGRTYYHG